jgi:hypothetical protein
MSALALGRIAITSAGPFRAMNRGQPTPRAGQSRATAPSSRKLSKIALDGTATKYVTVARRLRDNKDARKLSRG